MIINYLNDVTLYEILIIKILMFTAKNIIIWFTLFFIFDTVMFQGNILDFTLILNLLFISLLDSAYFIYRKVTSGL